MNTIGSLPGEEHACLGGVRSAASAANAALLGDREGDMSTAVSRMLDDDQPHKDARFGKSESYDPSIALTKPK